MALLTPISNTNSGTSGYSGYSGKSGASGLSGISGYSGLLGISGASGYSGRSGASGYSGSSGISGYSGAATPLGTYLPLAGGTMTGDIAMGNHSISGLNTLTGNSTSAVLMGSNLDLQANDLLFHAGNAAIGSDVSGNAFIDANSITLGAATDLAGNTLTTNSGNIYLSTPAHQSAGDGVGGSLNMDAGTINFGGLGTNQMQVTNNSGVFGIGLFGSNLYMNDGTGSSGGNISMDGGRLQFDAGTYIQSDGFGGLNFNVGNSLTMTGEINLNGYGMVMNGGLFEPDDLSEMSGDGSGNVSFDATSFTFNATTFAVNGTIISLDNSGAFIQGSAGVVALGGNSISINCPLDMSIQDIVTDTSTGTKIGTATNQKFGFWNAGPVGQPTTGVGSATFVTNSGTAINSASTFDGYTLAKVVKALRNIGILA